MTTWVQFDENHIRQRLIRTDEVHTASDHLDFQTCLLKNPDAVDGFRNGFHFREETK